MRHTCLLLPVLIFFFSLQSRAQSALPKGETQLNAGIGFSGWGVPFYIGLDHAVHNNVTIGGEFSYRGYNQKWRNVYYRHAIAGFALNGNYHFNNLLRISPVPMGSWVLPLSFDG